MHKSVWQKYCNVQLRISRFLVIAFTSLILLFPTFAFAGKMVINPDQGYQPLAPATTSVLLERGEILPLHKIRKQTERFQHQGERYINYGQATEQSWHLVTVINSSNQAIQRLLASAPVPTIVEAFLVFPDQRVQVLQPSALQNIANLFEFELPAQSQAELWMSVKTPSLNFNLAILELYDLPTFLDHENNFLLLEAMYYGAVFLMALYNLILFFSLRQKIYLYYSLMLCAGMFYFTGMDLVGARYVWDISWNIRIAYAGGSCFAIMVILFCNSLLDIESHSPKLYPVLRLLLWLHVSFLFLNAFGFLEKIATFTNATAMLIPIILFIVGLFALPTAGQTAKLFLIAWSVYLVSIIQIMLVLVGLPIFELNMNEAGLWMKLGCLIEITLFSLALAQRIQQMQKDRYKAQKQLATVARESSRLLETKVEERTLELRKANATKDKFFSIIAHDLRGPIGTLSVLYNEVLESPKDLDMSIFKTTGASMRNTHELLNDLLDWAHTQTGHIEQHATDFNLVSPIERMIELLRPQLEQKKIKLVFEKEDIFVHADPSMVATVIRNLFANAIKFTAEGGTITLGATLKECQPYFYIQDTGIGIEEKQISKLFMIGESISTSVGTANESGSGLGLILCHEFIGKNQGKIGVTSKVGEGSHFWFSLPLGKKQEHPEKKDSQLPQLLKEMTCLIVDDNLLHLESSKQVLKQLDVPCRVVMNGKEALAALEEQLDRLVLLDIDMPVMNGIQTLGHIRANFDRQPILIAVSCYNKKELGSRLGEERFDAYLQKPLQQDKLLAVIQRSLAGY